MWNLFKETYIGPLRGPKRKVRQYLLGKLLSGLGSWGQAAAFAWVAAQVSGSISAYGLVIAARKVPTAATLVSGKLVDRWSPKAVLLVVASVQSMHAALLFSLWRVGQLNLPWLVALAGAAGLLECMEAPARQALVAQLADDNDALRKLLGLNAVVSCLSPLLGPLLSASLNSTVGIGYTFAVNAVTYWIELGTLGFLKTGAMKVRSETSAIASAGLLVNRNTRLFAVAAVIIAGLLSNAFVTMLPLVAGERGGSSLYGEMTIALAAGGFVAVFAVPLISNLGSAVAVALMLGGAATAIASVHSLVGAIGSATVSGAAASIAFAGATQIFQRTLVSPATRGRLMSWFFTAELGSSALSSVLATQVTGAWGVRSALLGL